MGWALAARSALEKLQRRRLHVADEGPPRLECRADVDALLQVVGEDEPARLLVARTSHVGTSPALKRRDDVPDDEAHAVFAFPPSMTCKRT